MILLVLPVLFSAIGSSVDSIAHLPSKAGASFISSVHSAGTLSPWTGLTVLVGWVLAAFGLAAYLLRRRDA